MKHFTLLHHTSAVTKRVNRGIIPPLPHPLPPSPPTKHTDKNKIRLKETAVSQDRTAPSFFGWQFPFSFLHLRVRAVLPPDVGLVQIHQVTVCGVQVRGVVAFPLLLLQNLLTQLQEWLKDSCCHHLWLVCHLRLSKVTCYLIIITCHILFVKRQWLSLLSAHLLILSSLVVQR